MATIEAGLRADVMRKRMEDKNTLTTKGALYVGSGTSSTVNGTVIYNTQALTASGSTGYVLCSNGANQIPSYQRVGTNGIADGAITNDKIALNAITSNKIQSIHASKIDGFSMSYNENTYTLTINWRG